MIHRYGSCGGTVRDMGSGRLHMILKRAFFATIALLLVRSMDALDS